MPRAAPRYNNGWSKNPMMQPTNISYNDFRKPYVGFPKEETGHVLSNFDVSGIVSSYVGNNLQISDPGLRWVQH
jgi:hypothetical protein